MPTHITLVVFLLNSTHTYMITHVSWSKKNVIAYLNNSVDNVEKNSWLYHSPWRADPKIERCFLHGDASCKTRKGHYIPTTGRWDQSPEKNLRKKNWVCAATPTGLGGAIVMMYNYTGRTRTFLQLQRIMPLIPGQTRDTCFSSYKSRPSVSKGRSSISLLYMYT